MKSKTFVCALLLLAQATLANVVVVDWIGDDGDSWDDASNWNPAVVPHNSFSTQYDVTIHTPPGQEEGRIVFSRDRNVNSIECSGSVDLEVGHWDLSVQSTSGITNFGNLGISGEGMEHGVQGNITNTAEGSFMVSNWLEINNLTNEGLVRVVPGGNLSVEDSRIVNAANMSFLGGTIINKGRLDNQATGIISGYGFMVTIGDFNNVGDISANAALNLVYGQSFTNTGSIANMANGSINLLPMAGVVDVNNAGILKVNAGGGITVNSPLTNLTGGSVVLCGGTLSATRITQQAGAHWEGFGSVTGDLTLESNALVKFTGPTFIFGDLQIDSNARLEMSDGTTIITGQVTNNGTIHQNNENNGRFICQGKLLNNGIVE